MQSTDGKPSLNNTTVSLTTQFAELGERLAWMDGTAVTRLVIKADDDGWLVVLAGRKQGKPVVHFTGGRSWFDAVEALLWEINHGRLNWRPDKYARK